MISFHFASFSSEKVLAQELVKKLSIELPATLMENRRKVLSVNKITRLLEQTYLMAYNYQRLHKIGFIKRSVLANYFKWELKNSKYPSDFIEMATEGLIVALTKVELIR